MNPFFICADAMDIYKGHQIESEDQMLYYMKARISTTTVVVVASDHSGGGGVGGSGGSVGMKLNSFTVPRLPTTLYLQWTTKVWMGKWQRTNRFVAMAMAMAIETIAPPEYSISTK